MSYEYEEVVNLVLKTNEFNVALNQAEAMFGRAKGAFDKLAIVEMRVDDKKLKFDLDKAYKNVLNSIDAQAKAEVTAKTNAQKISAEIAAQYRKADERANVVSIKELEKQRLEEARALYRYRREMDREAAKAEREEAVALHRYRMEMDRERLQLQKQQAREVAQFGKIFTSGGAPLPVTSAAPSMVNVSATLRAGAGAAGMFGMYPAAGAMYATANAMQALGMSTITAGKALAIFTPALAAIGTVFFGTKFVEYGAEFSRELARMSTLMLSTKATAEEFSVALDKTAQSAFKLSKAFNMDAVDVVKAFKDALSSGIDVSDLERFTTVAATLSAATATGIQDTTNLLTSIKDSYGLTVSEMTHQTDLLFNSINVGKIQIPAYVNGFARLSDAGHAAGISLEDLHIAIDTMTRQGMPANRVMTSMVALIHALQSPSEQAKKAMTGLGIVFGDAAFEGKSLISVVEEIKSKTRGGVGSIIGDVFDDERARQAIRSLMQGVNLAKTEIAPALAEVGTSAIAADRAMNNLFDNWQKSILGVTNSIKSSSAETGGWLNQLFYGNDGKEKADFVAKMERMKAIATSGIERGQSETAIRNAMMVTERPDLFNSNAQTRWDKGDRSGAGHFDPLMVEMKKYMTESTAAMIEAYALAKDAALIDIRKINDEFDASLRNVFKNLDALEKHAELKKMSKVATKEYDSRATDVQKQQVLDLQEAIEAEKASLAEARKKLEEDVAARQTAYRDKNIQPIEDEINKANAEGGDKKSIPALHEKLKTAQVEFKAFMVSIDEEVKNSKVLAPFVSEINNLTSAIETMRLRISNQDGKVNRDAKKESAKKEAHDELIAKEHFVADVERLYREDVANYKKAQEDRKAIFKRIDAEILKESKRNAALQSDIQKDILGAKLSQNRDDPRAQVRISRAEKEANLEDLKKLARSGTNPDAFNNAVSRYRDSAASQRDAGSAEDLRRATRIFIEDMEALSKISNDFNSKFGESAAGRKASMSAHDNSVAIRSPQELAKAAAIEAKAQTEITKVVADVKLKLEVDGNLSEKSQNDIANKVVEKVKQMMKNNNPPPSTYDSRTRNPSTSIGIDE